MDKTLHLNLKKKWFDLIASGEKKEEYREIKPYWVKRLCFNFESEYDEWNTESVAEAVKEKSNALTYDLKNYNTIYFKNGYAKDAPAITLECKGIFIGEGKPQWGAPQTDVFIIKLGEIIT